jgi:hypothetical protein
VIVVSAGTLRRFCARRSRRYEALAVRTVPSGV